MPSIAELGCPLPRESGEASRTQLRAGRRAFRGQLGGVSFPPAEVPAAYTRTLEAQWLQRPAWGCGVDSPRCDFCQAFTHARRSFTFLQRICESTTLPHHSDQFSFRRFALQIGLAPFSGALRHESREITGRTGGVAGVCRAPCRLNSLQIACSVIGPITAGLVAPLRAGNRHRQDGRFLRNRPVVRHVHATRRVPVGRWVRCHAVGSVWCWSASKMLVPFRV